MSFLLALVLSTGTADAKPARLPTVLAGAERFDVRDQFRAWSASQGATGAASELVCQDLAEAVQLCFSTETDGARSYLTEAARAAMGKGAENASLERAARKHAKAAVAEMQRRVPEGLPEAPTYWVSAREDGRAHAPLLDPSTLTARFGKNWVVAVPTRDLLVLWSPGELQFDKIMAVGVRKAFDAAPDAQVSPLVYRWTDEGWKTWGAAVPDPAAASTTDDFGAPPSFP